jgi:hypothetical protein
VDLDLQGSRLGRHFHAPQEVVGVGVQAYA